MKSKFFSYCSIVVLMSFMSTGSVQASTVWSSVAGGCVPEDPTMEKNIHFTVTGGMRVKFRSGTSGSIKIVCPITIPFFGKVVPTTAEDTFIVLNVYYQDPDGRENNYQVKAHLRSVNLSNGDIASLCTTDSNLENSISMWSLMSCQPKFRLGVGHAYWVEIEINRKFKTNREVEINAVELAIVVG